MSTAERSWGGMESHGTQHQEENAAVDDAGAERVARLHLALAGGDSARFADRGEIEAAALIEARFPGAGAQFAGTYRFHGSIARRGVSIDGMAGAVFGAAGFPGPAPQHSEAAEVAPTARFVYADPSEQAAHLNAELLAGPGVSAVRASVRDPQHLMSLPEVKSLGSPFQMHLQLCAHYWTDRECRDLTAAYGELLPPGSDLVLSLWVPDGSPAGAEFLGMLGAAAGCPAYGHSLADVERWLDSARLELLPPRIGRVRPVRHGRPGRDPGGSRPPGRVCGAVARVR